MVSSRTVSQRVTSWSQSGFLSRARASERRVGTFHPAPPGESVFLREKNVRSCSQLLKVFFFPVFSLFPLPQTSSPSTRPTSTSASSTTRRVASSCTGSLRLRLRYATIRTVSRCTTRTPGKSRGGFRGNARAQHVSVSRKREYTVVLLSRVRPAGGQVPAVRVWAGGWYGGRQPRIVRFQCVGGGGATGSCRVWGGGAVWLFDLLRPSLQHTPWHA